MSARVAVIAFRTMPIVHATTQTKYEVTWLATSDQGDESNKNSSANILTKEINDYAAGGWEYVGEMPYTHVGNTIVTFLVFKK